MSRVETPRLTLKGTSLSVDVVISQTGYAGQTVPLQVEDSGRIVSSEQVKLPNDGESATVRVTFEAKDAGARLFRFRVPAQADEQVTQNNTRDALVEVSDRRERVLYMEGEPRYEVKFIRRAVEGDDNLRVTILQRTAEDKYLRLDVGSPEELVGGFPKTRDELFAYRAIILGSVEAASFSPDQLRMLADFVSKRGGGLLMIGGRRAFAEGGWAGTPVAEVLPVELEGAASKNNQPEALWLSVQPTREGATFPVTQARSGRQVVDRPMERAAESHDRQSDRQGRNRARRSCSPVKTIGAASTSSSPTSDTGAASRSSSRSRTRSSGRWTRRSR